MKFYYVRNIFDLHSFDNETNAPFKFFQISQKCILFRYFF